ncbi:MAG TPA: hypothetical protein VE994_21445 [Terriglobales bacterium]|nr:hypothetical protein [Terriglobales bacterium]
MAGVGDDIGTFFNQDVGEGKKITEIGDRVIGGSGDRVIGPSGDRVI